MGLYIGILIVLISIYNYISANRNITFNVMFPLYWGVICILVSIPFQGYSVVDDAIYVMVLFGVLCFIIGYNFGKKYRIVFFRRLEEKPYVINLVFAFLFIIFIILDLNVIKLVRSGSTFSRIRYTQMDKVLNSYLIAAIYKFLASPLLTAFIIAFFSDVASRKRINKRLFAMTLILTIMEFIAIFDRKYLLLWIAGVACLLFVFRKNFPVSFRKKLLKIGIILCALIIGVIYVRGGKIFESIYTYLTGGLRYFSVRREEYSGLTYGMASLQGIFRPILGILERINIKWKLFEDASDFLMDNQNTAIYINYSRKVYLNYFTTCFAYFFKDLGWLGVVLMPFLWGILAGRSSRIMIKGNVDSKSIGLYILLTYSILFSMMNNLFCEVSFAWGVIFFCLFFVGKCKDNKNYWKRGII